MEIFRLSIGILSLVLFSSIALATPLASDVKSEIDQLRTALAQEKVAIEELRLIRTFRCKFDRGNVVTIQNGIFSSSPGDFANDGSELIIDDVDLSQNSARIIGNAGAGDLQAFEAGNGINFLELPGATVNTYTIFSLPTGVKGEFYAVTSRHVLAYGKFAPSQYPGKCKIWARK